MYAARLIVVQNINGDKHEPGTSQQTGDDPPKTFLSALQEEEADRLEVETETTIPSSEVNNDVVRESGEHNHAGDAARIEAAEVLQNVRHRISSISRSITGSISKTSKHFEHKTNHQKTYEHNMMLLNIGESLLSLVISELRKMEKR
ncbi:hypothetical protein FQA39_LY00223 [Lamprigera yunnana]|nr:hypothetical protein FQA39_LY00223 [Lamprigera yunnana]